jgi:hypothetical protein
MTQSTGDFGALGYAQSTPMPANAPPLAVTPPKDWQVWADVRGTGWNTNVSDGRSLVRPHFADTWSI